MSIILIDPRSDCFVSLVFQTSVCDRACVRIDLYCWCEEHTTEHLYYYILNINKPIGRLSKIKLSRLTEIYTRLCFRYTEFAHVRGTARVFYTILIDFIANLILENTRTQIAYYYIMPNESWYVHILCRRLSCTFRINATTIANTPQSY